jgi:NMD protein affecting ribosome stability and mRNA decay
MTEPTEPGTPTRQEDAETGGVTVEVRFADRACPRCRSRFVASYYRAGEYVKSRCLDCMLFWPTPLMA